MNYLALVQRLGMECGIANTGPGVGPSTCQNQTGEILRLVTWIDAAWQDIQTAHKDWGWMRQSASFPTVLGQSVYTNGTGAGQTGVPVANLGAWIRDTARNYVTSTGQKSEIFMDYLSYDVWRNTYLYAALRFANVRALQFSIDPNKSICIPPALDGYTIEIDYYSAPVHLVNDADIPSLPEWYHMAIVYKAMMMYGAFEAATEVYQRGELEFGKLMERMNSDRMPEMQFAGALV